jgi:hypothetical protein
VPAVRQVVELVLIVAIAIGGYLAWQTGQERARLQRTFDRLARKAGDLEIGDPNQVHLRAFPTGEPLHFAWRVYLPASYPARVRVQTGRLFREASGSRSRPLEFIARVRFREDENGVLNVYWKFAGYDRRESVGDRAFATLLRGRWNELAAEQLGADGLVALDPDRMNTLLRLRLPADLQEYAKTALSPDQRKELVPVFFELQLGSPASQSDP